MCIQEITIFLQQHIILCSVWMLLLIIALYAIINNWLFRSFEILCDKAIYLINRENAIVIDVRSQSDYRSGYILNSVNVSIKEIKNNDVFKLKKFKKYPLIVVHDNNALAHSIKKRLYKLKFEKVYVLHGGMVEWKANNFPVLLKDKLLK